MYQHLNYEGEKFRGVGEKSIRVEKGKHLEKKNINMNRPKSRCKKEREENAFPGRRGRDRTRKTLPIRNTEREIEGRKVDKGRVRIRFSLIDARAKMLDNGKHHEREE